MADIAVLLDCIACRRHARVVRFHRDLPGARCCPGRSARHLGPRPFPGEMLGIAVEQRASGFEATYRIAYDTHPFADARHGGHLDYRGYPMWANATWTASCPDCGGRCELGTQSNLVRPYDRRCRCSRVMHREVVEQPRVRYLDPDARAWRDVPPRHLQFGG
jgi:hypothetical protein